MVFVKSEREESVVEEKQITAERECEANKYEEEL